MITIAFFCGLLLQATTVSAAAPRFAIYIAEPLLECPLGEDGRYQDVPTPSTIALARHPWVTDETIEAFDAETNTVTLRDGSNIVFPSPSVHGSVFVVTAGSKRVFAGVFWTPLSSQVGCPLPHISTDGEFPPTHRPVREFRIDGLSDYPQIRELLSAIAGPQQ